MTWRSAIGAAWKRLVRWLARDEIAQAYETGSAMTQALAMQQAEMLAQAAFARGQCAGRQEMYDHISDQVTARTGGAPDFVMPEDLARAKKGLLH